MAVTIRASAKAALSTTQVIIPATTQVGDLLLLHVSQYNALAPAPSGSWTLINQTTGTGGSYSIFQQIYWRLAVNGDAGTAITFSGASSNLYNYGGIILTVITGHHATTPINTWNASGGSASPISDGSVTTTNTSRRFFLISQMSNGPVVPNFGAPSGGLTVIESRPGDASTYFRAAAYSRDAQDATGTYTSPSSSTDQPGSWVAHNIAIREGNVSPTASNLSPNTFRDNRVSTNFTWTYTDAESNAQNAYEIQYRLKGSTGAWTTVSGTTSQSHTFAANTFTLGQEYEWQVRVSDALAGYGEWSTLTYFLAGVSAWTEQSEVVTSTQSGSIAGLSAGTYYVQVRTADSEGYGPWSASDTVIVNPPTNISVKSGGTFAAKTNWVKVGGIWKQVPPTKYKSGGAFN